MGDACDFARYCSSLDFWSINDHAEALTPRRWKETVESIQQCNAVGGAGDNPDTVAFLGWEWTQVGATPENHYGHKNVIFRSIDDDAIPTRPIHSGGLAAVALRGLPLKSAVALVALDPGQRTLDFARYLEELRQTHECPDGVPVRDLPDDCRESAEKPEQLFRKLDDWGFESIVIPHGTTWGFYTPASSTWDKQLSGAGHDPDRQILFEVFSGHGNSEEFREFRGAVLNEFDQPICPEASNVYLPSCQRAGEIIRGRCLAEDRSHADCDQLAADARQNYINAGTGGHISIRGETVYDWLDAGQCRDCFIPAFNYRPGGAAQYIMAISNFDNPDTPRRFRFGFMASSDNHKAKPGTGYKEFYRQGMTESAIGPIDERAEKAFREPPDDPVAETYEVDFSAFRVNLGELNLIATGSPVRRVEGAAFLITERERQASFFTTGGLIAAHSDGRNRAAIWDSMQRKEVYGTSGDRILLWFDLLNAADGDVVRMGGDTTLHVAPEFEVRAIGAFEQMPGCPEETLNAMSPKRLDKLCRSECYNPSDKRKIISRVEVIRILPQQTPGENVANLIQDPWRILPCRPEPDGCTVRFSDEQFDDLARDAVYYVRAIQEPSPTVNADNLRCEFDDNGICIKVNPCFGGRQTPADDNCLAMSEERAWSSPIFVDWNADANSSGIIANRPNPEIPSRR